MSACKSFQERANWLKAECYCSAFVLAVLLAAPVRAETGSEIAVSASTAFDSNPFLAFGDDPEVVSFRLELVPTVYRSDEVSSLRVSARVEHVEYARLYDSVDNLSVNVAAQRQLSERLQVDANLSVSSTVSTTDFNRPIASVGEQEPGVPSFPIIDDITLVGDRQRRNLASVNTSLRYQLNEFDDLRWSSSVQAQRYGSARLQDSDFAAQRAEYSRRMSEYVFLGGSIEASASNFKNTRIGDAMTISPQVSVRARLFPPVQFSASAGVAITRTEVATGKSTSTTMAGNASLCYKGALSNLCLNGVRQVLPSAIGGVRKQSTFGTTYSLRLSERETAQFGGSYSLASAPLAGTGVSAVPAVTAGKFESIRTYARYERQLDERFRLFASAGYSDSSDDLDVRRSNFQGAIGITVKFGRAK